MIGGPSPASVLARTFAVAGVLLAAAAVTAATGALSGWALTGWATLHLALLGGVSMLVLGAAQFFAGAFLATDPPSAGLMRAQRLLWPAGVAIVVAGRAAGAAWLVAGGYALLAATLAVFAAALRQLERRSLQRAPWAVRWYQAATAFLVVGGALGAELARGASWVPGDGIAAHVTLNVLGWLGSAIVGTVHTFVPSMVGRPLARLRWQRPTFSLWTAGVAALAAGWLVDVPGLAVAGLALLLAAAALLVANLALTVRGADAARHVPASLVLTGQTALCAALVLALTAAPGDPSALGAAARDALGVLLVPGWVGLTVAGSLLVLMGPAARRGPAMRRMPLPRRWWPALAPAAGSAVGGLAAGALLDLAPLAIAGRALLALAALPVAIAILRTARDGLRPPPPAPPPSATRCASRRAAAQVEAGS